MKLQNQIAIVTGGGGVLGGAIARQLAAEGAKVYLFDIRAAYAAKNAESIIAAGGKSQAVGVNITQAEEVKERIDAIHAANGRIDILVNCAGGSARERMKPFHQQSLEVVGDIISVNLFGMLNCTHAVSRHMVSAGSGKIINIGSIIADQGLESAVDYAAAKGAVISATRALAKELGPYNININCVSPGIVLREAVEDPEGYARSHSYLNKLCTPDDIASMVQFLTFKEASFITGQNYIVDGGRCLAMMGSNPRS
jgi:NAD(P)-dependent dehydrogenase (short-subunit alcohol dehydrogenase family)